VLPPTAILDTPYLAPRDCQRGDYAPSEVCRVVDFGALYGIYRGLFPASVGHREREFCRYVSTTVSAMEGCYNRVEMKTIWIMACLVGLVVSTTCTTERSYAAPPVSTALSEIIPNTAERLESPDIRERIKVLDELVVPIGGDVAGWKLRYNLPTQDYVEVLNAVLAEDLRGLDAKTLLIAISKACYVINDLKLREMAAPIASYLRDTAPSIQYSILYTLQAIGATETTPKVVPLLKSPEEWIRRDALETLVELHAKEAIPSLVERLQDTDEISRYHALMGLIKVNGKEAVSSIAKLLDDPDENNRYWALDALVKLGAAEHAADIWRLLDGDEPPQTEAYAVAALIAFHEQRAIPLAVARAIVKDLSPRLQMLDFLVQVHAREVAPALVAVLKNAGVLGGDIGTDSNIRRDIMVCLGRLEATEAIPVLRDYVNKPKNSFLRGAAVSALGVLRAKEASEDLVPLLSKSVTGDIFESAEVAVALAKMGDKKTWLRLIQFAESPNHPNRSEIIVQLNAFLDPRLWQVVQTRKVQGMYVKQVNTTVEALSIESDIRIVLHDRPQQNPGASILPEPWPQANTGVGEINLISGIEEIMEAFGQKNNPLTKNPYTFVFKNGEIHIMPVAEAVQWWKENMLSAPSKAP
jgi:HEAT repeat protein